MLENAHGYEGAAPARMSRLTENMLGGLDYDRIAKTRMSNYLALDARLADCNELVLCHNLRIPDTGPFVYPMLVKNGPALRKKLAAQKIFELFYFILKRKLINSSNFN